MEYTLIRQSRKTIGIYIKNGGVEVRAPHKVSKVEIDKFVAAKEKWIAEKLAVSQERQEKRQEFTVSYGSMLLWRGEEFPLVGDSGSDRIWRDDRGFHFPPSLDEEGLKYNVIRLYKICAKNYLIERVRHFAEIMGDMPSDVKVTEAKTRWGSCSKRIPQKAKKTNPYAPLSISKMLKNIQAAAGAPVYGVNFSWRLMMAEDDVIDAVVVHELAHIKEMNHSPAFYGIVKSVLPDYDKRDAKLKILSKRLGCEDWGI